MSVPYTFGTNTYAQSGQLDANFASVVNGSVQKTGDTMTGALTTTALTTGGAIICGGILSIPSSTSLYLNGATSGTPCRLYADTLNIHLVSPVTSGGEFSFETGTGAQIAFIDTAGNIVIQGSTAQKASGTTWSNPSSRDIKQDIAPYGIGKGLQAVLALNPVTYRFNEDSGLGTDETHIGLVHDETGHMPEMHRKARIGEGREVDALDCSAVIFALIRAVQELSAKIEALEKGR